MDIHLPEELERAIFLIAATSDESLISSLLLVAQRVKEWIEPLRFRSLVVETCDFLQVRHPGKDLQNLDREQRICWLALGKPAEFLARHVKFVQVSVERSGFDTIVPFLSLMPSLTDLAIWSSSTDYTFPDLSTFRELTYISLNWISGGNFCNFLLDHPSCVLRITHMEFGYDTVPKLLPLITTQLPHLSHFRLSGWWYSKTKDALDPFICLVNLDQMRVVVISVIDSVAIPSNVAQKYPILRHPKVTLKSFAGWEEEWMLRVEGKPDIWARGGALDRGSN
ncbi:hypothetical protein DL96DRAFT_1627046 [Flagelloscypha sp. PMI_526]|nr:hypothetical protein DL96DRAFT_1627046 [Flagelloscypha sp. PMI_526]